MTRINSQAFPTDLPAIRVHHESTNTKMLKFVGVCTDGAEKVTICFHSEQEPLGYADHDRLIVQE